LADRVLITGALGFIGRALGERYRALGWEVAGVDRVADPALGVVAGDVAEAGPWQAAAEGCDLVIHTAAIVSNAPGLEAQWRVNVLGTRRAMDAAREAGVRRFVHLSSVRAFSDRDFPDGVNEDWPVRPDGAAYVETKIASEQVALQAHAAGETEVTVIRPADVYGPGSRPWTLLPLEAIRTGRALLPARGRGIFSPVYLDNLIDGIVLAAEQPAAAGQVFTIGDGRAVTTAEFFGYYREMLGEGRIALAPTWLALALAGAAAAVNRMRGVESESTPEAVRYLARRGTYSIEKARHVLGYDPAVGLEEGMERTAAWLREQALIPSQRTSR
jgi:nucleoside-diphosphate-sugar epimerase